MSRKKPPIPTPIYWSTINHGIELIDLSVWNNLADEGRRGSWKKRPASTALSLLIDAYMDKLLNPLNSTTVSNNALIKLLGKRQTSKLIVEIKPILRKHKLSFGKTAIWLLAADLQKTFAILQNALVANQNSLKRLPINSTELRLRKKLLKGTF